MSLESDIRYMLATDAEFDAPLAFEWDAEQLAWDCFQRLTDAREEIQRLREVVNSGDYVKFARELCAQQIEVFASRSPTQEMADMVRKWAAEVRADK